MKPKRDSQRVPLNFNLQTNSNARSRSWTTPAKLKGKDKRWKREKEDKTLENKASKSKDRAKGKRGRRKTSIPQVRTDKRIVKADKEKPVKSVERGSMMLYDTLAKGNEQYMSEIKKQDSFRTRGGVAVLQCSLDMEHIKESQKQLSTREAMAADKEEQCSPPGTPTFYRMMETGIDKLSKSQNTKTECCSSFSKDDKNKESHDKGKGSLHNQFAMRDLHVCVAAMEKARDDLMKFSTGKASTPISSTFHDIDVIEKRGLLLLWKNSKCKQYYFVLFGDILVAAEPLNK